MNCPGHIQIYKNDLHSYRGCRSVSPRWERVYRYERSGVMHGLFAACAALRRMTPTSSAVRPTAQDLKKSSILTLEVLKTFGFH